MGQKDGPSALLADGLAGGKYVKRLVLTVTGVYLLGSCLSIALPDRCPRAIAV
jgi:hypothetical protein